MDTNPLFDWKHDNAGFFIWCYFPKRNVSGERFDVLISKLYDISKWPKGVLEKKRKAFLNRGSLVMDSAGHNPSGLRYVVSIDIASTSGFPDVPSAGSHFEREEMASLVLADYNSYVKYDRQWTVELFLDLINLFFSIFQPVYGFGHIDYNKWCDTFIHSPPPETRIWPYNMFNLEFYEPTLRNRLKRFALKHTDEWELRYLECDMVVLITKKLDTPEDAIGLDVTKEILGEVDEPLVKKGGYSLYNR